MENIDDRLTQEVTSLSTKLVTAVAKQSELEESILQYHRESTQLKQDNAKLAQYQGWYTTMLPKYSKLQDELRRTREAKTLAETKNSQLQAEVEDLTASLFSEANKMVNNASQETENFKVKNRKLYEELNEKDTIIEDLQEQLRDLKGLFVRIDEQQKTGATIGTPRDEQDGFTLGKSSSTLNLGSGANNVPPSTESNPFHYHQLHSTVFSPNINAIRLDLNNYNQDFKAFIYALIKPDFTFDLANLIKLRYFKRIWTEEMEPAITNIPPLPVASLMNRWQRGSKFWHYIVEGRVMITPVKGINEIFRAAYRGNATGNTSSVYTSQAPVAIREPCSFCGESRDSVLEHSRLYYFKLLHGDAGVNSSEDDIIASYPLCNYCHIKMRTICDYFAKLRSVHSNVYRLEHDGRFDEYAYSTTMTFKRNSQIQSTSQTNQTTTTTTISSTVTTDTASVTSDPNLMNSDVQQSKTESLEEAKLVKIYVTLALIRNKIWWSKIGYWDTPENVLEANLDDIHYEAFANMVGGNTTSVRTTPATTPVVAPAATIPAAQGVPVHSVPPVHAVPPILGGAGHAIHAVPPPLTAESSSESSAPTAGGSSSAPPVLKAAATTTPKATSASTTPKATSATTTPKPSKITTTPIGLKAPNVPKASTAPTSPASIEPKRSKVAELISKVEAQSMEDYDEDGGSIRSGESASSRRSRARRLASLS